MNVNLNLRQLNQQLLQAADELRLALPANYKELSIVARMQQIGSALLVKQEQRLTRGDRKSTRLNSSHGTLSRMPSSA